jgi:carbonic anhydrase
MERGGGFMKSKRIGGWLSERRFASEWIVILAMAGVAACSDDSGIAGDPHDAGGTADVHTVHWTYEGDDGPEHWGDLSPDYALCKTGEKQSPVDIPSSVVPGPLQGVTLAYAAAPGAIFDNGHTVQVNITGGNKITEGGKDYALAQFHFHMHSEHSVGGASQPLEMHLVHTASDGAYTVLGVFLKSGAANAPLDEVFTQMASATETPAPLSHDIDPTTLIPAVKDGWAYDGSLTTPPCTEGVNWRVYGVPLEASPEQIDKFKHDPSNRPSQPLNARTVSGGN